MYKIDNSIILYVMPSLLTQQLWYTFIGDICSRYITLHHRVYPFTGLDYWTGILDWNIGLAYFWFLHILWLKCIESHKPRVLREPTAHY